MAAGVFRGFERDRGTWNREFNSSKGMVGGWLRGEGNKVAATARKLVHVRSGRLRSSIERSHVSISPAGLFVDVEANAPYARAHHEGYDPYVIRPEDRQVLVFPSRGGVVFTQEVQHPGYGGNPFLRNALIAVSTRWK